MGDLKISGFKNSTASQYDDLDLSKPVDPATPVEPVVVEPKPEVIESVDPTANIEPVVEPIEPSGKVIEKGTEGVPSEPSSLKPDPVEVEYQFNEEKAFAYLSEKLGKKVNSFDDLKTNNSNPLDDDPYLKGLAEWRKKTGRPIEDWIKYQKDYSKLSDLEVAREFLQHEYPSFTPAEINDELKTFQSDDMDDDADVSKKARELKKYSTKGRAVLGELVSSFGEVSNQALPPEIQADLKLAQQVKNDYKANQEATISYNEKITQAANTTDVFKLSLSDDLSIDFKVSEESKKGLPEMINTMPQWKNPDGSWNHKAVVNDAVKIKHFDEMLKLAFEQGVSSGKEDEIKEINNTTLGEPTPMIAGQAGKKSIQIEGLDTFIGGSKMTIRKRK